MQYPKKGKDASDPNNTRGITITPQILKTYETVIKQNNTIPSSQHPLQFGFTKDASPDMGTLCVTEVSAEAKYNNSPLYYIALDAQKAFDVVSHPILFHKLLTDGTPRDTVSAIMAMYADASEIVVWDGLLANHTRSIKEYDKEGSSRQSYISYTLTSYYTGFREPTLDPK